MEKTILFFNILLLIQATNNSKMIYFYSEINITIRGTGSQNIFYSSFANLPNEIYINGNIQSTNSRSYYFNESVNIVTLRWNYEFESFAEMFRRVNNLVKADFSNFKSKKIKNMYNMFSNCVSLTSVNFKNFDTSSVTIMSFMFDTCTSLTSIDLSNFNTSSVVDINAMFDDCHSLKKIDLTNFDTSKVTDMNYMFFSNYALKSAKLNFDTTKVNKFNEMFAYCNNLIYLNLYSFTVQSNSDISNIFLNINPNIIYCYNKNTASRFNSLISANSYNCNYIEDYDDDEDIINNFCLDDKICLSNNISAILGTEEKEQIIENIQNSLINGDMNNVISEVKDGNDFLIQDKFTSILITTPENQIKNKNKNISTISLSECLELLIMEYNLPKDESIYILKIDEKKEGMIIPKIEYELYYYPSQETKLEKFNLSVCEDTKANITIPVDINESELYKYDTSSDYYNDLCNTFTSEKGVDMTLKDRKIVYVENNYTLCEEDCIYKGYDSLSKEVICSCEIKLNLPLISTIVIDKNKLYDSFSNIKNIANLNIMKCYHVLFNKSRIIKNIGFYFISIIIIFYFFCLIFFFVHDLKKIEKYIDYLVKAKKYKNFFNNLKKYNKALSFTNNSEENLTILRNKKKNKKLKLNSGNILIKLNKYEKSEENKTNSPTKKILYKNKKSNKNKAKDLSIKIMETNTLDMLNKIKKNKIPHKLKKKFKNTKNIKINLN